MRFFLDEGVPDGVGRALESFGHVAIRLRDAIPTGSPDELVAIAAIENDSILVACDGDMKAMARKFGLSNSRYRRLSLVKLSCGPVMAASRITQAMSLIEHEWAYSQEKTARRLFVEIQTHAIRTIR